MWFVLALVSLFTMYAWAINSIVAPTIRSLYDVSSDVFGWDKCYPVNNDYTGCTYEYLESQIISYSIFAILLLSIYFEFDLENVWEWFSPGFLTRAATRQRHLEDIAAKELACETTTISITPSEIPPPRPLPTYTPPQVQFLNFRATGNSFQSRTRSNPMSDEPFRCPEAWKGRDTFLDVEQERKNGFVFEPIPDGPIGEKRWSYKGPERESISMPVTLDAEDTPRTTDVVPEPAEKPVVNTLSVNVADLPPRSTPVLTPTHIIPVVIPSAPPDPALISPLVTSITVSAPEPAPTSTPLQGTECHLAPQTTESVPLQNVVYQQAQPSVSDVFARFAAKGDSLGSEMRAFLGADFDGGEWIVSARAIACLMDDARDKLAPFFPIGMSANQSTPMLWNDKIIDFWACIRPYGQELKEHRDEGLSVFVEGVFNFGIYLGLRQYLGDMEFKQPTAPELPSLPPPPPVHTPSQMPLAQKPLQSLPLPSTQYPPGRAEQQQTTLPNTTGCIQAPPKLMPRAPQATASSSSHMQQQAVPSGIGLLKFNSTSWCIKPDDELEALTWQSFNWPDEPTAREKIWQHSPSAEARTSCKPKGSTEDHKRPLFVKAELHRMGYRFRRATVVLLMQAKLGKSGEVTGNKPLLDEIQDLVKLAGDMTDASGVDFKAGGQGNWGDACAFFANSVRDVKAILEALRAAYQGRVDDLCREWDKHEAKWVDTE